MAKKAGAPIKSALNSPSGITSLLTFVILALACVAGFSSRLFAVIRFESIIHEFDPWLVAQCGALISFAWGYNM